MTTAIDESAMTPGAVQARRWFTDHGLPTGREEDWRYTPVDDVRRRLEALSEMPAPAVVVDGADVDRLAGRHGAIRIVLVDGVPAPTSSPSELPPGLWCGTTGCLSQAMRQHLTPVGDPPDGFEALNRSASPAAVHMVVADGLDLADPVHVVHVSTGARVTHPRLVIAVGVGSRFHLVETHVGVDGGGLTNASTTVRLAVDAHMTIHRVQDEHPETFHIGRLHLTQRQGSHSEVTVLSHGAATSRLSTGIDLVEPTSSCRVTGLLAPRPGARHDDAVTVGHVASDCASDLAVRAVVPEQARTTSSGHVIVRPGTVGSVVHQRADSLLLDRTAQADSRPWLEIFADDVRANHGSATGRLDEDALFYLRSRGIPHDDARSVLVGAFARTVVEQVEPLSLRTRIAEWFGWEADT